MNFKIVKIKWVTGVENVFLEQPYNKNNIWIFPKLNKEFKFQG